MSGETMNPIVTYLGSSLLVGTLFGMISMWQWGWFGG